MMIGDKKLIIDKDELFIVKDITRSNSAVGNFAVLTNKGVILQMGCVLNDGTYLSNDDLLPDKDEKNGVIRGFKELFTDDISLRNFETYFTFYLDNSDPISVWNRLNDKLSKTSEGKNLVVQQGLKIHAIINLKEDGYGISINDLDKTKHGKKGNVYVLDKKSLLLVMGEKNIKLS
jgi:hypothetical protein